MWHLDGTLKLSELGHALAVEIGLQNLRSHSIALTILKVESMIGLEALRNDVELEGEVLLYSGV